MRKSLAWWVGTILVFAIGFILYTRTVDARRWRASDGGWTYSVARTCRDGISFSLAFFLERPVNIEVNVGTEIIAQQELILSNDPINLDPDPNADRPGSGRFPYSGVFTVPWSPALASGTEVQLKFWTLEDNGSRFEWTPEQPYVVADCYLPDLSITVADDPDPVTPVGTLSYAVNVNNPSLQGLVDETAVDVFPTSGEFITIPAVGTEVGPASPYPSEIAVAGLTGSVTRITATLSGLSHNIPDDLDILLVGPRGQKVILMSDAGGGFGFSFVDLTFDDTAAALPDNEQIQPGSYKPTDYADDADDFPGPAPAGPYDSTLASFKNTDPNGTWKLYVVDDQSGNGGELIDWKLTITTTTRAATVVDTLPEGTTFNTATGTGWDCSHSSSVVTCTTESLGLDAAPPITIVVRAPAAIGTISNTVSIAGSLPDPNLANNIATEHTAMRRAMSQVYLPLIRR